MHAGTLSRERLIHLLLSVSSVVAVLLVWWVGHRYARFVPPPDVVMSDIPEFIATQDILGNLWASLRRVIIGLAIGLVLGTVTALAMASSRRWNDFLETYVVIAFGIPGLAAALFALMVFGLAETGVYAAIAVIIYPFVTVGLKEGAASVDVELVEMSRVYDYGPARRIRHIILPTIAPDFMSTTRNMHALSWKIGIIAEVFLGRDGLGAEFKRAFDQFQLEPVILWLGVFLVTLFAIEYLILRPLERFSSRWRP